ncbi:hypothetical protein BG011_006495 [Mortierella polycephala]|uniref:Uncharacterized protein n=1 Tax=Mortierella polycephala TaxID=41804 RepID=A0A9P6TZV7_9FUNG|nr:hypothetical protein BG011_006495 [Mortierella polycephala]
MKSAFVAVAIAALSTVSAYQCPSTREVDQSCKSISVSPSGLANPFGNSDQYKPGEGTKAFAPSSTSLVGGPGATRVFDGTTYYGGQTTVISGTTRIVSATAVAGGSMIVSGTTTWASNTPGVVSGTSTPWTASGTSLTAAPITVPTNDQNGVPIESHHISGGSVAGIVLGCVAATILAGLLGWCWRKQRNRHTTVYNSHAASDNRGPTRTVVTEKIEPVVVKSVPAGAGASTASPGNTGYSTTNPGNTGYSTTNPGNTGYSTTNPGATGYSTNTNPGTTGYNSTTTTGYNTQPRTGAVGGVNSNVHNNAIP